MAITAPPTDRLSPFGITTHAYKTVDDHDILLDILVPEKLIKEGPSSEKWETKRPLLIRYHGGWLIGGGRDVVREFPCWILDLALKHDAIVVSPDHRLVPEASAEDVLDDIDDLWKWIGTKLDAAMQQSYSGLHPDLSRVLVTGESVGGYLAMQTAFSFYDPVLSMSASAVPAIRAVIAQYPAVSLRTPHWTDKYEKNLFGIPMLPESVIDEFLAAVSAEKEKTGKQPVISNGSLFNEKGEFNNRGLFAFASHQNGRYLEVIGRERDTRPGKRRLYPEDRIEDGKILPPICFIQGTNDTITLPAGCDMFVEHVRKFKAVNGLAQGKAENDVLMYQKVPGEHLFENDINLDEKANPWVGEVATFVEGHWLN